MTCCGKLSGDFGYILTGNFNSFFCLYSFIEMRKKIFLIILGIFSPAYVFAGNQASQLLQSTVPEVLHIDKIIVENVEYEKDEELKNVQIRQTELIDEHCCCLSLTPFSVRITTNLSEPIQVSAKMESCCSTCGRYPLDNEDLMVTPSSYTINNPHDKIETDFFTPKVHAHDDTVCTTYRAHLTVTLGRV